MFLKRTMLYSIEGNIILNELSSITLNNAALDRKETVKFLEVCLDEGLNWKFHTKHISVRMAKFPLFFLGPTYV